MTISFKKAVGEGDMTYNPRRNILGALTVKRKIAYHLYHISLNPSKVSEAVKLCRKSQWHPHYSKWLWNTLRDNASSIIAFLLDEMITTLDFNPLGESVATIDRNGVCVISDVDTTNVNFDMDTKKKGIWDYPSIISQI